MMIEKNMSFDDALKLAQENGYAEKDPTADIEGHDACRKICILASLCFGKHVYPESVHTEGITKVTLSDVAYVNNLGGVIKLIGRAKRLGNGKISAVVSPCVVMTSSQLANVSDVFNAILVRGDAIGDVVFYGRGAGSFLPQALLLQTLLTVQSTPTAKRFSAGDRARTTMLLITESLTQHSLSVLPQTILKKRKRLSKRYSVLLNLYRETISPKTNSLS